MLQLKSWKMYFQNPQKIKKAGQHLMFGAAHVFTDLFCSPKCKNQYNVYKSRKKNKEQE